MLLVYNILEEIAVTLSEHGVTVNCRPSFSSSTAAAVQMFLPAGKKSKYVKKLEHYGFRINDTIHSFILSFME